jgi:putative transposase
MRFRFISQHLREFGVARLCAVMEVSRSGFYAWRRRSTSARKREDGRLQVLIRGIHKKSRGTYGVPRVHQELRAMGEPISRKRVARLMVEDGLEGRSPRRSGRFSTTKAPLDVVGENVLNRQFAVASPNRVWVADTTYLSTSDGPAFLVAILDLFSRRVVGWAAGAHLDTELARRALARALALRQPTEGLLFHSDRGGEFVSHAFQADLDRVAARRSLSRPGECYDNAPAESFFGTLKDELDIEHGRQFASPEHVEDVMADYIDIFYNRERRHSTNNYLSPIDFEMKSRQLALAA